MPRLIKSMVIGFTGPQTGMTTQQRAKLFKLLLTNAPNIAAAHHGDCVGGDEEFHDMCVQLRIPEIYIHPPIENSKRAWCGMNSDGTAMRLKHTTIYLLPTKPFLERDADIARQCTTLFATPAQAVEVQRSGTWATIRYAKKHGKLVIALHPETGLKLEV